MDKRSAFASNRRSTPVPLFASIGHQDNWGKVVRVLNALRADHLRPLGADEVRDVVEWIPPRTVVRVRIRSWPDRREIDGVYIDTFLPPEALGPSSFRAYVGRIQEAAQAAEREGVRIAALGGFTSIVLEGDLGILDTKGTSVFTTGNSLTTAYIVKGIEEACRRLGVDLTQAELLVVGSTGDIGSACVRDLMRRVRSIALCARNPRRLQCQLEGVEKAGARAVADTDVSKLLPRADVVILAASARQGEISLAGLPDHAVVCDAGYPKNASVSDDRLLERLFHGGMGFARGGFDFEPDLLDVIYDFPLRGIGHGCMLEGIALAFEGRFEAFSTGRGEITPDAVETIWRIAERHGMGLAPLYNHEGLWSESIGAQEQTPPS